MIREFSKKLLCLDYIVLAVFIAGYFLCVALNGIYTRSVFNQMLADGIETSYASIPQLFTLDGFVTFFSIWIGQLGISSLAYYRMCRSDHKVQLPIRLISDLPEDVKKEVDMTQIITTVLNVNDN